jgi:hypothetical protein
MTDSNGHQKKATNGDGRDPVTGQFVRGWRGGPGRPPSRDLRNEIEKHATANNIDLGAAAWELLEKLRERGMKDDTPAAKVWLARVYGEVMKELTADIHTMHGAHPDHAPEVPTGDALGDWLAGLAEIQNDRDQP